MNNNIAQYRRLYPKVLVTAVLLIIGSIYLIRRNDEPKENFFHQKGTISYLSQIHPLGGGTEPHPKMFYLTLYEYPRVFEMFIGNEKGDFSPRLNRLNELKKGDIIDVYFAETNKTRTSEINSLLRYLEKNGELYFVTSSSDKLIGTLALGGSILLFMLGIYMKMKSD